MVLLRTMPEATGCWEVEGLPERTLQVWCLLTIHTLSGKQSSDMNPTASNPSLSVAAFLSRSNTIGIHPDGQGDVGCYNPQSKIPTPKAKPHSQPRQRDIIDRSLN